MRSEAIRKRVPDYLARYIADQNPSLYTPMDHASWRYIMRVSRRFFARHAHPKYLAGLEETGISLERVPLISEMDERLGRFGWHAAPVVGFIPPAVFMEFLSLGVLPIACDMRQIEHLAYTPAPDIVHEAAGHAPIIADPEYAAYLRCYGDIAPKVIFSAGDMEVYEAVRRLSDLKEDPESTADDIRDAQEALDRAVGSNAEASEATQLARMSWWTIEYGLVGTMEAPKIYGAGLLSSVGESYHCLGPEVRKLPFSIECIDVAYDITRPQPQLFVTPDFPTLSRVLDDLAETMSFRKGGLYGLRTAQRAGTVATVVLDSGIQLSGTVAEVLVGSLPQPVFIRLTGPCQLAMHGAELPGHGPERHPAGFSAPLGGIRNSRSTVCDLSASELAAMRKLEFESGITLEGRFERAVQDHGKNVLITYANCRVTLGDRVLFHPDWGPFDLACGTAVVSVFGGAADRSRYLASPAVNGAAGAHGSRSEVPRRPKTNLTAGNRQLNLLYQRLRELRESGAQSEQALESIHEELNASYPGDWLLRLELLELGPRRLAQGLRQELARIAAGSRDKAEMIARGLELL